MEIRHKIKALMRGLRISQETSNREAVTRHREAIRRLWRHRNTDKQVSEVM
jgi:hypothetical protein